MEKKDLTVLLPGSYDPPTRGHLSLIERAAREYGRVLAVAFVNPKKEYTFSPAERVEMLRKMTEHLPNASADFSEGLVIDYARAHGATLLIKGYRNEKDLAYEKEQADWNRKNGGIETLLLPAEDGMEQISSTAARAAMQAGADTEGLLDRRVADLVGKIEKKRREKS